jgi:hypothetical protein
MGARETLYKPFGCQVLREILQRALTADPVPSGEARQGS